MCIEGECVCCEEGSMYVVWREVCMLCGGECVYRGGVYIEGSVYREECV